MSETGNNFKVRLIPISSLVSGQDPAAIRASQVAFNVTPTFTESGSVEYSAVTPVHMPGSIQMYRHTNSRTFEIGATLISRTVEDAIDNMKSLQKLRAWRKPYFGATNTLTSSNELNRQGLALDNGEQQINGEDQQAVALNRIKREGIQLRGAPPDVLYLYAYSTSDNDDRKSAIGVNINRVPVVLTSLSITFPDDVDYIPVYDASKGGPDVFSEPFPRKMTVSISLVETHSPREFENFDLMQFKAGKLAHF